jgi:hypothetical protein
LSWNGSEFATESATIGISLLSASRALSVSAGLVQSFGHSPSNSFVDSDDFPPSARLNASFQPGQSNVLHSILIVRSQFLNVTIRPPITGNLRPSSAFHHSTAFPASLNLDLSGPFNETGLSMDSSPMVSSLALWPTFNPLSQALPPSHGLLMTLRPAASLSFTRTGLLTFSQSHAVSPEIPNSAALLRSASALQPSGSSPSSLFSPAAASGLLSAVALAGIAVAVTALFAAAIGYLLYRSLHKEVITLNSEASGASGDHCATEAAAQILEAASLYLDNLVFESEWPTEPMDFGSATQADFDDMPDEQFGLIGSLVHSFM